MVTNILKCIVFITASILTSSTFALDQEQFVTDITHVREIAKIDGLEKAIELWLSKKELYANTSGHYEYELGVLYHLSKNYKRSEEAYKSGIKFTNKYPRLYTGLALTYMAQEDIVSAREWAEKAVKEYPRWPVAYSVMGNIEFHIKNYKAAMMHAEKSLSLKESALAYYLLGASSFYLGDYRTAAISTNKAIKADSSYLEDKDTMLLYAESLVNINEFTAAYSALEALANNNPRVSRDDITNKISQIKIIEKAHNKRL